MQFALLPVSWKIKTAITKTNGVNILNIRYHFTLSEAGLKGLNMVMIRSMQRNKLSSSEKVWKNRKKFEFDQQSAFR
jgi:hypothetical protein